MSLRICERADSVYRACRTTGFGRLTNNGTEIEESVIEFLETVQGRPTFYFLSDPPFPSGFCVERSSRDTGQNPHDI